MTRVELLDDVQDDDLDVVTLQRVERLLTIADGSDDREVRIRLERPSQQPADHRAVVDHHDAVWRRRSSRGAHSRDGRWRRG